MSGKLAPFGKTDTAIPLVVRVSAMESLASPKGGCPLMIVLRTVGIIEGVDHVLERRDAALHDLFTVLGIDLIGRAFAPATGLRLGPAGAL
jgi:hypothetical protein